MMRLRITPRAHRQALAAAVDVLRGGGIVAYPTDTLYGLAADPKSDRAIARLLEVKDRDRTLAIPLIAGDLEQAREAGEFGSDQLRLARAFWPGPLAIVVPARDRLSRAAVAADGTVAIRVPANAIARGLASAFGGCITATSANLSGQAPTASPDEVASSIGDRIDLLIDAGESPGGLPSTIVALRHGSPVLVRAGAIAWDRVLESLNRQP